jgi:uncharacterized protein YbcI
MPDDLAVSRTDPVARTLQAVSNEMVRIYKEQFGRGPTRSRASWCSDDLLCCVLEDTFTRAEQNMQKMGEYQRLRDIRMFFQYASEQEFRAAVESITGRKIRSFLSAVDAENDIALETFLLEPAA